MRNIQNLVLGGHEVTYKLLSIGSFKYDGVEYIQVHCDRRDIEFSHMYDMRQIKKAVFKYIDLYNDYLNSEGRYGNFVPLEAMKAKNVPK